MRHTVGVHQSVILTRKLYYAAFCQGTIMSFYSTMWLGVMRLGGVRLGCMRHFTTPPITDLWNGENTAHIDKTRLRPGGDKVWIK